MKELKAVVKLSGVYGIWQVVLMKGDTEVMSEGNWGFRSNADEEAERINEILREN